MWEELNFGMDSLTINDNPTFPEERSTNFLNLKSTREGTDLHSNYPYQNADDERDIIMLKFLQMVAEAEEH